MTQHSSAAPPTASASSRPSPGSLIVTFYGAYGRDFPSGGTVPVATLIRTLAAVGIDSPSVRSAVSRLKRRGLLTADQPGSKAAGYAPSPAARQLLDDGDRRIYERARPDGRCGNPGAAVRWPGKAAFTLKKTYRVEAKDNNEITVVVE